LHRADDREARPPSDEQIVPGQPQSGFIALAERLNLSLTLRHRFAAVRQSRRLNQAESPPASAAMFAVKGDSFQAYDHDQGTD
jgi:hypothetical protein